MIKDYSKLKTNSLVSLTGIDENSVSADITTYDMTGTQSTVIQTQTLYELDAQLAQLQPIIQEIRALRADVVAAILITTPDAVIPEVVSLF